jgi:hypothetical protein
MNEKLLEAVARLMILVEELLKLIAKQRGLL